MITRLALKSLINRKGSVALCVLTLTLSIFVLLGVDHVRHQAKENISNTVSGVDLIIGARTSRLNLLLYSVFRIGSPTNNIRWQSYEDITAHKLIKWAVPISLGDSHKGFRVLGTNVDYFKHYSYGKKHPLTMKQGRVFKTVFDVVLGSEVANKLGYEIGDSLTLAHGIAKTSFTLHDNMPFKVSGILAATGTPVDQTLHVSLQGIEAIHMDSSRSIMNIDLATLANSANQSALSPKSISAFMVGLKSRMATFTIQRKINQFNSEPLMAILPGVALSELWQIMGTVENLLLLVSILVFISACLGVSAMLLASIREREQEIHLLRVLGAPHGIIILLIEAETLIITLLSIVLAMVLLAAFLVLGQDALLTYFGLNISSNVLTDNSLIILTAILATSALSALIPALYAFRESIKTS